MDFKEVKAKCQGCKHLFYGKEFEQNAFRLIPFCQKRDREVNLFENTVICRFLYILKNFFLTLPGDPDQEEKIKNEIKKV